LEKDSDICDTGYAW